MSQIKPTKQTTHSKEVALHDNGLHAGSLISQAMGRLSKKQANSLIAKAGEEALRLEVQKREQDPPVAG